MNLKKYTRIFNNIILDMKFGRMFLGGSIQTKYSMLGAHDTSNSDYGALNYIFEDEINPNEVLVDVGCGKGRVINYWLSKGLENKIIGLELDPEVANFTKSRLKQYKNVEILHGDAIDNLPSEGTIFYLFNPFNETVMIRFKEKIYEMFGQTNRIKIIYYNCQHLQIFENDNRWVVKKIKTNLPNMHETAIIENKI